MRLGVKIVFTISILIINNACALQYPLPAFNNIRSGYENGKWWIIPNMPTLVEGGSWGAGLPQYYAGYLVMKSENNEKMVPIGFGLKKKSGESKSALFMRVHNQNGGNRPGNPLTMYPQKHFISFDPSNGCLTFTSVTTNGQKITAAEDGPCFSYIPPIPAQCNITTSEIILDHKTVLEKDMEGSTVDSNFKINCSREGTVKFSLDNGKSTISLGDGNSTISINDLPLKSNIKVSNGDNNLKIQSVLHGVKPGAWQGSAVLKFEPF